MKYLYILLATLSSSALAQSVDVFSEKTDSTINFYARSSYYCHYTAVIQFEVFENMTSSTALPATFVIEPQAEKQYLLSVKQKSAARSWKYKVQYRLDQGNLVNTKHDDAYPYALPYKSARAHKLVQGYFGKFSHAQAHSLDFEMPVGTSIVAAREGVVIEIKQNSNVGGLTREFIDKGNYVLIYHSDGTFASYFHLKLNGVLVKVGQQIEKGEVIGFSGNTGWSSAPHLHFEVLLPASGVKKTTSTKFIVGNGKVEALQEGNAY